MKMVEFESGEIITRWTRIVGKVLKSAGRRRGW